MVSRRRSRIRRDLQRGLVVGTGLVLCISGAARADLGERAFEMVSPPDKGGYPVLWTEDAVNVGATQLSPDGNAAIYASFGLFAGAQSGMPQSYRAVRTDQGWTTVVVSPRDVTAIPDLGAQYGNIWRAATPDLRFGLVKTRDDLDHGGPEDSIDLFRASIDGGVSLISVGDAGERLPNDGGPSPENDELISNDGARSFFRTAEHIDSIDAGRTAGSDVYERRGGRTILLNQDGNGNLLSKCGSILGGNNWIRAVRTSRNAISSNGRSVIFSVPSGIVEFSEPDCFATPTRIFMKSDNQGLLEVSASEATVADTPQYANYQGAASDGSRVYFTSSEMLTDGISSGGLYAYDVHAPRGERLRLVVPISDIAVVKTSDDGSTVYFTSGEQVAPGGRPGTNALYVYRNTGSGPSLTWIADDEAGDFPGLIAPYQERERLATVSHNGATLAFVSAGRLTTFDNTNHGTGSRAYQVYVYNVRDGLNCASCDAAGQRPAYAPVTGNASIGPGGAARTVADDGAAVFFSSPDRLVVEDENSARDVYEYSHGRVRLISAGRGPSNASLADASASGDTVLFSTAESLVPQDKDGGDLDMYVARVGGGFPPPPERPAAGVGCEDDGCQGAGMQPPVQETPGSSGVDGDPPVDQQLRAAASARALPLSRQQLRRLARTGSATLSVRTAGAGVVHLTIEARIAGRLRVVARGTVRAPAGQSTVRVRVRLARVARQAAAKRQALRLQVTARFANQPRVVTVTAVLRSASPFRGGRR